MGRTTEDAELSEEDQQKFEETFADFDGSFNEEIDSAALNEWLFNENTVNKVLKLLMDNGLRVNDGETIGKTIIFAKNQRHAQFIEYCFNLAYPFLKGHYLQVVTHSSDKPEENIAKFKIANKFPQIVVSVDMLDTGIDVPEILNLVFFKSVKSSSKYWQMIGRGTRLCPDVFGPGKNKEEFYIFDYCGNIEFFGDNPKGIEPSATISLSQRVFLLKNELAVTLEKFVDDDELNEYRKEILNEQQQEVSLLNRDSFVNRPHLRLIETFSDRDNWNSLTEDKLRDLNKSIVPLLINSDPDFKARRFDAVIYRLMNAYLIEDKSIPKYIDIIKSNATELLKRTSIPHVALKKDLLSSLVNDTYWQNVKVRGLEHIRQEIRALMKFIEDEKQPKIYTNFIDQLTGEIEEVKIINDYVGLEAYDKRVASFIRRNSNYIAINKIKNNEPISVDELEQIKQLLFAENPEAASHLEEVLNGKDFIIFVRSIIGLEAKAAKDLFAEFINRPGITAEQINFMDTLINYLTQNGTIDKTMLFDRPFTDINHEGVLGVFADEDAIKIIDSFNRTSNLA